MKTEKKDKAAKLRSLGWATEEELKTKGKRALIRFTARKANGETLFPPNAHLNPNDRTFFDWLNGFLPTKPSKPVKGLGNARAPTTLPPRVVKEIGPNLPEAHQACVTDSLKCRGTWRPKYTTFFSPELAVFMGIWEAAGFPASEEAFLSSEAFTNRMLLGIAG